MTRPRMYAAMTGVMYGVCEFFVDLIAGKADSRSSVMVLALAGEMTRAAIPWLLGSAWNRRHNRSLKCTRPWSFATIGTSTPIRRDASHPEGRYSLPKQNNHIYMFKQEIYLYKEYIPGYKIFYVIAIQHSIFQYITG